jgi:hypothetical protein
MPSAFEHFASLAPYFEGFSKAVVNDFSVSTIWAFTPVFALVKVATLVFTAEFQEEILDTNFVVSDCRKVGAFWNGGTVRNANCLTPASVKFCTRSKYSSSTLSVGGVVASQNGFPRSFMPIQIATRRLSEVQGAYSGFMARYWLKYPTCCLTSGVLPRTSEVSTVAPYTAKSYVRRSEVLSCSVTTPAQFSPPLVVDPPLPIGLPAEGYPDVIQKPVLEYESPNTTIYFVPSLDVLVVQEDGILKRAARASMRGKEIMVISQHEWARHRIRWTLRLKTSRQL